MRLIDADLMEMKVVKTAQAMNFIAGNNDADEVAGALLCIIENEPTVELKNERLIPKKPKNIYRSIMPLGTDGLLYGECPSCKSVVLKSGKAIRRYCSCCGQALEWEEEI